MTSLFPDDRTLRLLRLRVRKIHNRHVAEEMSLYPKKVQKERRGLDGSSGRRRRVDSIIPCVRA